MNSAFMSMDGRYLARSQDGGAFLCGNEANIATGMWCSRAMQELLPTGCI